MRKINLLPVVACLSTLMISAPLGAQETNGQKLEKLEDHTPPTITIRKPSTEGAQITEEREGGAVKKVKVKSGGSTYYLKPKGAKASPPSEANVSETSIPQWSVKEFDAGSQPDGEPGEGFPEAPAQSK